jgi:hypothetical protein
MKTKLITLITMFYCLSNFAQCNFEKTIVQEKVMKQFPPRPISADIKRQYALSINEFDNSKYLLLTIRFKGNFEKNNENLILDLSNGEKINLKSLKFGNDYIGGNDITHNQYLLTNSDIEKLKKSEINAIKLNFINGEKVYLETNKFKDYIKENLKCLE